MPKNTLSASFQIFTKHYWKSALSETKSVRILTLSAILIALQVVVSSIFIPVTISAGEQRIYFTFLIVAIGSAIYGPVHSIYVGLVADIVGFLIHPTGAYFVGYTIIAMVGGLIYGLFLYQTKITILKLTLCKLTINLVCNVFLNSLCVSFFVPSGWWVLLVARLPKNLIMLPIEVIMLVAVFTAVLPPLQKAKVIPDINPLGKLTWF